MQLISVNPTHRPKRKRKAASKGGPTMKRRKTARPVARKRHRNPTPRKAVRRRRIVHVNPKRTRRRVHRNPSFLGGSGSILKEILSMDGAMMIGAALAAPMVADYIQEKVMPTATGWTKLGIKAAVVLGGAYLIQKFGKKQKAALAFGVTGTAVLVADAVDLFKAPATLAGLSGAQADLMALNGQNAETLAALGYTEGLSGYSVGLSDNFGNAFRNSGRYA